MYQLEFMKLPSDLRNVITFSKYVCESCLSVSFHLSQKDFCHAIARVVLTSCHKEFYFLLSHPNSRKIIQRNFLSFLSYLILHVCDVNRAVFWSSVRVSQTMNEKVCIIFTNTSGKVGKGRLMHVLTHNEAKNMKNKILFSMFNTLLCHRYCRFYNNEQYDESFTRKLVSEKL